MEFMDKVSKRIVELREAKGETQQELADAIGITRQSLSRYEIAARTINVDVLGALAQHFNVTTDYLLGLSDVKSTEQDMKIACEVTGLAEETILKIKKNILDAKTIDVLVNSIIETDTFGKTSIIELISNYLGSADTNIYYEVIQELSHINFEWSSSYSKENPTKFAEEVFNYFIEEKMLNDIKKALQNIWNGLFISYSSRDTEQEDAANGKYNPEKE